MSLSSRFQNPYASIAQSLIVRNNVTYIQPRLNVISDNINHLQTQLQTMNNLLTSRLSLLESNVNQLQTETVPEVQASAKRAGDRVDRIAETVGTDPSNPDPPSQQPVTTRLSTVEQNLQSYQTLSLSRVGTVESSINAANLKNALSFKGSLDNQYLESIDPEDETNTNFVASIHPDNLNFPFQTFNPSYVDVGTSIPRDIYGYIKSPNDVFNLNFIKPMYTFTNTSIAPLNLLLSTSSPYSISFSYDIKVTLYLENQLYTKEPNETYTKNNIAPTDEQLNSIKLYVLPSTSLTTSYRIIPEQTETVFKVSADGILNLPRNELRLMKFTYSVTFSNADVQTFNPGFMVVNESEQNQIFKIYKGTLDVIHTGFHTVSP